MSCKEHTDSGGGPLPEPWPLLGSLLPVTAEDAICELFHETLFTLFLL
jgi:hypothetical protein